MNNKDKCEDCFAFQQDHVYGDMCIAPVCVKEYDYDPEIRTWIKKQSKSKYTPIQVIEGSLFDSIGDWKSEYKLHEDLPAIAEIFTEHILKALKVHGYKIIKENSEEKQ